MKLTQFLIAFILVIGAANALDVLETNVNITLEPGEVATATFQIKNDGSADISNIIFTHDIDLTDNDDNAIRLRFSDPGTITAGNSANVTITVDADSLIDINTYSGIVTVASGSLEDTFNFAISIEPVICDFGIQGSTLILDIEDPDNNDDFKPGDRLRIKANVENTGTKDVDVKAEAFLFGDEDEIEGAASEVQNIDNNDDEDFTFFMDIPLDSRRIERDQEYSLIIKAFDDDNERLLCTQTRIDLDVNLDSDDLKIDDKITRFEPASVSCGEIATATVSVINVGDDDQDNAFITLKNSRLGVNERTASFDIDDFDSDENNFVTRRIQFKISENAENGEYIFDAAVNYGRKITNTLMNLIVTGCGGAGFDEFQPSMSEISVVSGSINAKEGDVISVPVRMTNNGAQDLFSVEVVNADEFAEPTGSNTVSIDSGQSLTVFVLLKIKERVNPGRYSATLTLLRSGAVSGSDALIVDVTEKEEEPFDFGGLLDLPLWIYLLAGGLVILLLLAVVIYLWRK